MDRHTEGAEGNLQLPADCKRSPRSRLPNGLAWPVPRPGPNAVHRHFPGAGRCKQCDPCTPCISPHSIRLHCARQETDDDYSTVGHTQDSTVPYRRASPSLLRLNCRTRSSSVLQVPADLPDSSSHRRLQSHGQDGAELQTKCRSKAPVYVSLLY